MGKPWRNRHTAAVIGFVVTYALLGIVATQLKLTPHNHLGFWGAIAVGVLVLLLMIVIGLGDADRPDGILIDWRNRVSLANFQLVIWTLVVVASLSGVFFTNLLANVNPIDALDITVPPELWLVLGVSGGAFVGAKGLEQLQAGGGSAPMADAATGPTPPAAADAASPLAVGRVVVKAEEAHASWGDLFRSAYLVDDLHIDVAKVQMFVFTVILAFAYAATVANELIAAHGRLTELPALNSAFVTLLGLSQGGYLAAKVTKGVSP